MSKKYVFIIISLLFIMSVMIASTYSQQTPSGLRKLIVFYSATCHRCFQVKNEIMPDIEKMFKNRIEIEYLDIGEIENYKLLLSLKERYGSKIKEILPVFYFEGKFLNADGQIKRQLINFLNFSLRGVYKGIQEAPTLDLVARFKNFQPIAVVSAGLIDGINPCAFTVIVFFMSFLAIQGYRRRELIVIGLFFIFAVFLTYLLIGVGIFQFLYSLEGFWLAAKIFNVSIGLLSITLGIMSIYDFLKFKKSSRTEGLILQLPGAVKNQIHKVIGMHYRKAKDDNGHQTGMPIFRLILSAIISGFLVSLLEAVCTGQVYLPTITFVLKTSHLKLEAAGYLLLYNLMFIAPLVAIFILALLGTTSQQFAGFLKRHLLSVKMLMAILFFTLGIFLIWKG